jgi:hypothetical protein
MDSDVLLRQSPSGATEVRISFYNNHEGIIVRGHDVVNLINALRVQDETVDNSNMGRGPSTDFDFHQEGRDMRWVSLKPGATYNDWWVMLNQNTADRHQRFMRAQPATIHYMEQLFANCGHKLPSQ